RFDHVNEDETADRQSGPEQKLLDHGVTLSRQEGNGSPPIRPGPEEFARHTGISRGRRDYFENKPRNTRNDANFIFRGFSRISWFPFLVLLSGVQSPREPGRNRRPSPRNPRPTASIRFATRSPPKLLATHSYASSRWQITRHRRGTRSRLARSGVRSGLRSLMPGSTR